jgi:hypothetical protein
MQSSGLRRYVQRTETLVSTCIRQAGALSRMPVKHRLRAGDWPVLPRLSIRLTFHNPCKPLEAMNARIVKIEHGAVWVRCSSSDGFIHLDLKLNFARERLQADIIDGLRTVDDGSENSARAAVAAGRFKLDYFNNGILEVWNADTLHMLGRCEAFLPMNVDMNRSVANFEAGIRKSEEVADRRARGRPD